jgi:DNA-binding CsgD family transcriptional regulator
MFGDPEGVRLVQAQLLEVIDLAYQATTNPALWAPTLEGAADMMGGSAASLMWSGERGRGDGGIAVRGDPDALRLYYEHFEAINPIQIGFDRMRCNGVAAARPVMTDRDCVERDELVTGEYFNDFMRRYDLGNVMLITGASFVLDGSAPAFNVYRPIGTEGFGPAELEIATILHKPLQRAYQMSRRLARERRVNESLGEFVAQLAGAVFVVGSDGRIAYTNPAGESMLALRDGLFCDGRRLRACGGETQRRLASLLAAASSAEAVRRGGSLAIPRPSERRPLALLAIPTNGGADPQGGAPLVLLSVVDPELGEAVPEERLRAYFGFSPAEAHVAAELMAGYDPREIADRLGRSINTVRVQIARILEKTDTSRQSESVALMMRTLGLGRLGG